ncbi:hypothetical protein LP421_09010 [Rhizobium sp. RCAM05350]|nr:hypothetical protein LP421_09010 [Rhizobium sp. RCAM05350]
MPKSRHETVDFVGRHARFDAARQFVEAACRDLAGSLDPDKILRRIETDCAGVLVGR